MAAASARGVCRTARGARGSRSAFSRRGSETGPSPPLVSFSAAIVAAATVDHFEGGPGRGRGWGVCADKLDAAMVADWLAVALSTFWEVGGGRGERIGHGGRYGSTAGRRGASWGWPLDAHRNRQATSSPPGRLCTWPPPNMRAPVVGGWPEASHLPLPHAAPSRVRGAGGGRGPRHSVGRWPQAHPEGGQATAAASSAKREGDRGVVRCDLMRPLLCP